jgi:hypothetical protein
MIAPSRFRRAPHERRAGATTFRPIAAYRS